MFDRPGSWLEGLSAGPPNLWPGLIGGAIGLGAAVGVRSFLVEPEHLDVSHHQLPVSDLPATLDGYTIAQLTDLHFGTERGAHRGSLEWIEQNTPDLVVCTGDFVEAPEGLDAFDRFLDRLAAAADNIVAVLGNWEYKGSDAFTRDAVARYHAHNIRLLRNERIDLDCGVAIVGGDDPVTGHFRPERAFSDLSEAPFRLFLIHAPPPFDGAYPGEPSFDLSLAGHTHGGQFRLGRYAPVTPRGSGRFKSGFYDTNLGTAYVSRGVGMTFVRARFMCPPELPVFTLKDASSP